MSVNSQYILGNSLWLYYGDSSTGAAGDIDTPVAYATEATISLSSDSIDCASKSSGNWATSIAGQISWSASTSALYTTDQNFDALYEKMVAREPVYVKFAQCTIDSDGEAAPETLKSNTTYYFGPAFLTSLELQAGNAEVASFSAEFTGAGKLEKGTVS